MQKKKKLGMGKHGLESTRSCGRCVEAGADVKKKQWEGIRGFFCA
jgi:hypothetical protein